MFAVEKCFDLNKKQIKVVFLTLLASLSLLSCKSRRDHSEEILALPDAQPKVEEKKTEYKSLTGKVVVKKDTKEFNIEYKISLNADSEDTKDESKGTAEITFTKVDESPTGLDWVAKDKTIKLFNVGQPFYCEKLFCASFAGSKADKSRNEVKDAPDVVIIVQEPDASASKDEPVVVFDFLEGFEPVTSAKGDLTFSK